MSTASKECAKTRTVDIRQPFGLCPNCQHPVHVPSFARQIKIGDGGVRVSCGHCAMSVFSTTLVDGKVSREKDGDGRNVRKAVSRGEVLFKDLVGGYEPKAQATNDVKSEDRHVSADIVADSDWTDCSTWPDRVDEIVSTRDELPFIFDPAFEPLTDDAILIGANPEEVSLGNVLGHDFETGKDVVNQVIEADCTQEEGDWYHVTTKSGRQTLLFENQSIFANDNVTHAKLLAIGDVVFGLNGARDEILSIRKLTGAHTFFRLKVSGNHSYYLNGILMHNASRYGKATGNWNDNNSWAATDGGAAGASFPTSADDVFLTATSGAITITITASADCLGFDCTGYTGQLQNSGTNNFNVYGSFKLVAGMTWDTNNNTPVNFRSTSTGRTVTMGGKQFRNTTTFSGTGGGWTLQDNVTIASWALNLSEGTLDTNGKTVTCTVLQSNSSNTRTLTLGASVVNCTGLGCTATGLTVNANTSSLVITGNGPAAQFGGKTWYDVSIDQNGSVLPSINLSDGTPTFHNFTLTTSGGSAARWQVTANSFTVTNIFTVTGFNAGSARIQLFSDVIGTPRTITCNGTVALTNVDFRDITGGGSASWSGGTSFGNALGNSNITFTAPVARFYVGNTGNWFTTASWSTTSGGGSGASIPLCHDTITFDANSFSGNGQTCTINGANSNITIFACANIDFSAVTRTGCSLAASSISDVMFFGNYVANANVAHSTYLTLVGRGSQTYTPNGNSYGGSGFFLSAVTGTYTFQGAFVATGGPQLVSGTWTANNFSMTMGSFSSSNSNTRTLNMGSGTWTITGTGTPWDCSTATNLTLNASTSLINFTDNTNNGKQPNFGGKTYNNVRYSGTGASAVFSIDGASTVISGTLSFGAGAAGSFYFHGATQTVGNLDFTGFVGTWNDPSGFSITLTGNLTMVGGMTRNFNSGITFAATGAATITSAGQTFASAITFSGSGGIWTLQDAFTTTSTATLTQGTLALGSLTFTCTTFSTSNSNTRSITGTGTVLLTSSGSVWTSTTATNLTVASTVTIKLNDATASAKTFAGGGATFGNIWMTGAGSGTFDFTGSNTFNDFKIDTPPHTIRFTAGTTTTATTFTVNGTAGNLITLDSITASAHTLAKAGGGTVFCEYLSVKNSTASPASTFYARQSTSVSGNTNWYFGEYVTPATAEGTAESVAGTTILGSLSLTPAVIQGTAESVAGTAILGSLSLTPAVIDAVAEVVTGLAYMTVPVNAICVLGVAGEDLPAPRLSTPDFQMKQGDLTPMLQRQLRYSDGIPVDLTNYTVVFRMKRTDNSGSAIEKTAEITTAITGMVRVTDWAEDDVASPGLYIYEFQATGPDQIPLTVPTSSYGLLKIVAAIA